MKFREPESDLDRVLKEYAWANSGQVLDIVLENWQVLKAAKLLEEAFVDAWTTQKYGIPNWTLPFCRVVFEQWLDWDALRRAGDPIPAGESFVIYRGVAGTGNKRRVRGYSWTSDREVAKGFAARAGLSLGNPTVYTATICRRHVIAYLDASHRNEKEFLVWPSGLCGVRRISKL